MTLYTSVDIGSRRLSVCWSLAVDGGSMAGLELIEQPEDDQYGNRELDEEGERTEQTRDTADHRSDDLEHE
ncbi:hypothetical protein [Natrinema sp. SYSU A 869]|uniref:hypothetical protein n=1 Tax=Natrinema sp. SYSU A 869 TaxID=2871694 RepID=UPI001CA3C186|nr:hypothetical protein [Natrinema sp. SYSU A 869]